MRRVLAVVAVVGALVAGGCSSSNPHNEPARAASTNSGTRTGTLKVPGEFTSIQAAVDAAAPGALILVSPGTYHEAVNVTTDDLVIRGVDRNTVVLDGQQKLANGIRVLGADGVAVENMTAKNYTQNGFFWTTDVDGYRGSYLTAMRNGDYGIYAFGARDGVLEHSYASGSPDAGVYIGGCFPCNALVDDVVSEYNGLGYSGTNSGGDLTIVRSTFRYNRGGIVPNSGSYEGCAPQRKATIVGNLVYSNTNEATAAIENALLAQGNGIVVTGGTGNDIERNRVFDHDIGGITVAPFPEDDPVGPIPDNPSTDCLAGATASAASPAPSSSPSASSAGPLLWPAQDNVVKANDVSDSREADLILVAAASDGNRYCDNNVGTTLPANLQQLAPCDGALGDLGDSATNRFLTLIAQPKPPAPDYKDVQLPEPGALPGMANPETAPAAPARNVAFTVDVTTIPLPDHP